MASHSLAIAKASLAAAMIRPDPTSIPRTEIAQFHVILEQMLKQCSSTNIQLCKQWLLNNVLQSASRTAAVGKYLVVISASLRRTTEEPGSKPVKAQGPSDRRKQLFILNLLNDLLHHAKYHFESSSIFSILAGNFQPNLVDLFGSASAHSVDVYSNHHKKIQDLLDLWDSNGYYQSSYVAKLRETVANAARLGYPNADEECKSANGTGEEALGGEKKIVPYIMPASHGDYSTPYYDLPAGNLLPYITPNSAAPIEPQLVKPLQFTTGPADENLVAAVKDFLRNVDSLDEVRSEDEGISIDTDEMGQSTLRDEITGDVLEGEGYYGWSKSFCERMRRRGEGFGDISKAPRRNRSVDMSQSPRKRRRYSDSGSSRSRSRSRSSSVRSREEKRRRNGQQSVSRSRSVSPEPVQYRSLRSRSRSLPRSRSCSPPATISIKPPHLADPRPLPRAQGQGQSQLLRNPTRAFSQGFSLGPSGLPIPPPPPINYNGTWPPPPPPLMVNPDNAGQSYSGPPPPLPTDPRTYQNHGPPSNPQGAQENFRGHMLPDPGAWGQQQQQQQVGPSGSYPYGGRGRGEAPSSGYSHSRQSRGFGRRAWGR